MDDLFIGIDLGTTVCKAVVADRNLNILAEAQCRLSITVRPDGAAEQDAEDWWTAVCTAVIAALARPGVNPLMVRSIGISTQGIAFVPVDADCRPLRPAFSWMDIRAGAQIQAISHKLGDAQVFKTTGKRCSAAYTLPKLLWLMEHEPDVWRRTARVLMPLDFLIARLCGEFITDHSMASGTMLHDISRNCWSESLLETCGLDPARLPALRWSGEAAGLIRHQVAHALGLPTSTIIAVGGQDQKVAALGAGITADHCTVSLGTAMAILRQCSEPALDHQMRIPCFTDLVKDHWVIEASSDCCSILDWLKVLLLPGSDYQQLNALVEITDATVNPVIVLPFFSGAAAPHYQPAARGFIHGLDHSTSQAQLFRGFYEGMACLIRSNLEIMTELSGSIGKLRIFGGGSRSNYWCQMIADITEKPVQALANAEAASVGAVMLAMSCCGADTDDSIAGVGLPIRQTFLPRASFAQRSADKYNEYCTVRDRHLAGQA
jgi:xylulokinase